MALPVFGVGVSGCIAAGVGVAMVGATVVGIAVVGAAVMTDPAKHRGRWEPVLPGGCA